MTNSCGIMLNPMKINRRIDYMNELLQCIDQIDQSVNNAEINVLESLISSYDKALVILQECEVSDYSAFEIFQEGEKWEKFKEDTKAPVFILVWKEDIGMDSPLFPSFVRMVTA